MYYFFCCATVSFLGVVFAYILMNLPVTEYQLIARDEYDMLLSIPFFGSFHRRAYTGRSWLQNIPILEPTRYPNFSCSR